MKVTILDYGAGNLPSVERAFERLGVATERATTAESISHASAIVLPGVGHVAALIRALDTLGLREPLCEAVRRGVPFLGICLGLQVLFGSSEEAPELSGLNFFDGSIRALPNTVKLPHMGWNQVRGARESRLLRGLADNAWFYFAHSYAALEPGTCSAATCTHGAEFAAVIERDNISAVQFHPEKSGSSGASVFANFLEMTR
jgi:imidazole glycerol phosphate synthase glutamine amidotransferase subunit